MAGAAVEPSLALGTGGIVVRAGSSDEKFLLLSLYTNHGPLLIDPGESHGNGHAVDVASMECVGPSVGG